MFDKRLATYDPEIQFRWWHERVLQGVLRAVIAHGGIMAPFHPLGQRPHLPIVDIGCGTGAWVMDIGARPELRSVAVIGVDQNPAVIGVGDALLNHEKLGHCSLSCGDARYGLLYPDGAFGLVHLRHLKDDLRDDEWPVVLAEAARLVAPGGWLQCAEIEMPQVTLLGTNPVHYDGFLSLVRWRFLLVGITRREPYIADTLGTFMQEAGLVEIMDRTVSITISPTPVPAALADPFTLAGSYLQNWLMQYLERQGTEMEAQGIASGEDYQEALTRTRFDLSHHLVVLPVRIVCARKPRPGEPRRWPGLRRPQAQPLATPPATTPISVLSSASAPSPATPATPVTPTPLVPPTPGAGGTSYGNSWPFDHHDSLLGF